MATSRNVAALMLVFMPAQYNLCAAVRKRHRVIKSIRTICGARPVLTIISDPRL
jgi:hypothetical protein